MSNYLIQWLLAGHGLDLLLAMVVLASMVCIGCGVWLERRKGAGR